jgi:hypothetical protein
MSTRRVVLAVALGLAGAPAARAQSALAPAPAPVQPGTAGGSIPVQLGITVSPDTVAVGDPFLVRVRVRAPRGAAVEFPLAPDSASQVELLDPRAVRPGSDSAAVVVTAQYRAAAWDVGRRSLGFGGVSVRLGGQAREVPLGDVRVFVRSVLPADTAAPRDPKPARDVFEPEIPGWRRWLPYLIAALIVAGLLAWLWRRLRRRRPEPELDAFAEAEAGFARVDTLKLVEAGERGRYVALVVEVMRDYLARRVPEAHASLTSSELVAALAAHPAVPVARLSPLLGETDLIKFARHPVSAERALYIGQTAREVVRETEQQLVRLEAERAAAEQAAKRPVQVTTKQPGEQPPRAA